MNFPQNSKEGLAPWMPEVSWSAYKRELRLWCMATSLAPERHAAHVIYHGIRPHYRTLADLCVASLSSEVLMTPQDQSYVGTNEDTQNAIRKFTPLDRLLVFHG